ncbi:hypothetical protein [Streptomyces sp. NPDC018610]|uniref:hypothetical protein n=1 Tax=Streptomyces sp. NPDC018610 TaxID=3365049 RepID=UPI0037B12CA8
MRKTARFTAGTASAVLAFAASLAWATPAGASATEPTACKTIRQDSTSPVPALAGVLGVVVNPPGEYVGIECVTAPNGSDGVNFCRTGNVDFTSSLSHGRLPQEHTCP